MIPLSAHPSMSGQGAIGFCRGCFASCRWTNVHHSDSVTLLCMGVAEKLHARSTRDYLDRSFASASSMGKDIDLAVKYQRQLNDKVRLTIVRYHPL